MYLAGVIEAVIRGKTNPENQTCRFPHRVWPQYVDLNFHMNQASYLRVMELGRWQWIMQKGIYKRMTTERLKSVIGKIEIEYRMELKPLQKFDVLTRCVGIKGRAARLQQLFVVRDQVHTVQWADLLVLKDNRVAPKGLIDSIWQDVVEPEFIVKGKRLQNFH